MAMRVIGMIDTKIKSMQLSIGLKNGTTLKKLQKNMLLMVYRFLIKQI
jgi:hypothetical protein